MKRILAVALLIIASGTSAATFVTSNNVDPMTGKITGKYSTITSKDGSASLYLEWGKKGGAWLDVKSGLIDNALDDQGYVGRIRFGNGTVQKISGVVSRNFKSIQLGGHSDYSSSEDLGTNVISEKIRNHKGELKIEIPIYNLGNKVFVFNIN